MDAVWAGRSFGRRMSGINLDYRTVSVALSIAISLGFWTSSMDFGLRRPQCHLAFASTGCHLLREVYIFRNCYRMR